MGYVIVLAVLALGLWGIYSTLAHLRRNRCSTRWWVGFGLLLVLGLALGIWAGAFLEYQPRASIRIHGFPLPLVTFVWEQDRWTDFVPPRSVQYGSVVANIAAVVAVCLMPLMIVARIVQRRR